MEKLIEILEETPWWVYLVFIYVRIYTATHSYVPPMLAITQAAASGIILGIFLGRLGCFWKKHEEI